MENKEKIKTFRKNIQEIQDQINLLKKKIKEMKQECELELKNFLGE